MNLPYDHALEYFYKVDLKEEIKGNHVHLEIPEISFFYLLLHYHRLKPSIWLNYLYYLKKNFLAKYNTLAYFYKQFKAAEDCPGAGVRALYMFKEKTDYLYDKTDTSTVKRKRSDQKQDGMQQDGMQQYGIRLVDRENKRAKKQITQKQSSTKGTTSSSSSQNQQGKMQSRSGKKVDKDQNQQLIIDYSVIDYILSDEIPTLSYINK